MQEGDLTHDEINTAIGQAEKTIIFARQNRLRDGMVLVRLDRTEDYEELLDEVRSLGQHAVGEVLWRRPDWRFPRRTPGLLKLADEGDFDERVLALVEEISGKTRGVVAATTVGSARGLNRRVRFRAAATGPGGTCAT